MAHTRDRPADTTARVLLHRARRYLIAATIVWVAIWVATGAVDDDAFDEMLPILGGGTVFLIVIVPAAFFRKRP